MDDEKINGGSKYILPLNKAIKIQEALLPLGYTVLDFQQRSLSSMSDISLRLTDRVIKTPLINPSDVFRNKDCGFNNPDNSVEGSK